MFGIVFDTNQGWYLTVLSSLLCVAGCSVIYLDDLYELIFPRAITSRYPFKLNQNYVFLNGSLAFSAGCLLFTSLFRLLPEALKYLRDSQDDEHHEIKEPEVVKWLQTVLIISYVSGIFICLAFNGILHLITSESVVHCNHGGDNEDSNEPSLHSHSHGHSHDLESGKAGCSNNTHTFDAQDSSSDSHSSHSHTHGHSFQKQDLHIDSATETTELVTEDTPLIAKTVLKRKSLLHYLVPRSHESECVGECKGFGSAELCLYQTQMRPIDSLSSPQLHYCELPELANITNGTTFDLGELASNEHTHSLHRSITIDSHNHSHHPHDSQSVNTHGDHAAHGDDHHHHINSPLSRLLLIGIQTTLAITLHKLPEGFITFITSETNPQLGVSIFLSLLMHNFTEGFSMCLPLYYSFASGSSKTYSKLKAVSISGLLGGLSQPMGALIGYLFLQYNQEKYGNGDRIDLEQLDFIFGITLAVTSGFLTVIGLSMYGSAVSFGGSSNFVMLWCVFGIVIIGVSSIFSAST
ncbi:vacuolar Zn-iron permease [Scheffersomyces xylosifermentans]|uniref:vacuolar Zn-iron permease n=1 Tax=Scheffersomyces xylosifermentans TaxID=1304137 RepID=UPI00315D036D